MFVSIDYFYFSYLDVSQTWNTLEYLFKKLTGHYILTNILI